MHFPTRGRNLLRVQGDLLAAHALDIRNIFVVMGDPTAIGDYPDAMDNYDLVPSGLITLIKHNFNLGRRPCRYGYRAADLLLCWMRPQPGSPRPRARDEEPAAQDKRWR